FAVRKGVSENVPTHVGSRGGMEYRELILRVFGDDVERAKNVLAHHGIGGDGFAAGLREIPANHVRAGPKPSEGVEVVHLADVQRNGRGVAVPAVLHEEALTASREHGASKLAALTEH